MKIKIHTLTKFGSILILIGLFTTLTAQSALAQVTETELAGNSISDYPHFEYVKAINANDDVEVAIDPTRFPLIAGQTCDIYVVAAKKTLQWNVDNTLTDVRLGGMQTEIFSSADIQSNTFQIAAPNELSADAGLGLGVGYDVVLDCNQDGLLNDDDYIDGRRNESGFYRVHDTAAIGPEPVTELPLYSINTTVATSFGIPPGFEAQNLFFPTNVAGVQAATGENLPLVIVSHGNGHWYEDYDHIGNHLASYGYVVMSHRNNTVPGPVSASTTTLAHTDALIDQITAGAITGAGDLTGNIDTGRIVWIGHSRGAEGVAVAYDRMFDGTYMPIHFNMADIKLISSMLPTDFQGTGVTPCCGGNSPSTSIADPNDANYHLWTASGDDDVNGSAGASFLQTFHLHDRATGNRQSTTVQGTGHAWYHNGGGSSVFTGPCSIGEANTHLVQLGHFLPLVKRYVDDNIPSIDFLTRQYESFRPIGVPTGDPCIVVSHEYRDASPYNPSNPLAGIIIDDYQAPPGTGTGTSSSGASVTFDVDNLTEDRLDDNNSDFAWTSSDPFNGATQASATDLSRGVVFDWTGANRFYEWEIPVGERNFADNLFLSLRGAQGTRHPNTLAVLDDLTFTITLRDGSFAATSSSINIGAFGGGFEQPFQRSGGWHNEMETIRIRLTDFLNNSSGLDLTDIVAVRLDVGPAHGSPEGRIVIDDLMLTNDRAVYDARDNGDPHIKTVNGTNYDFHGAGEYTLLRDINYEIQTRQTPVTTANPLPNGYTGLSSCVAVNTALAARVGSHRISYQPDGPLDEQETRMRLRVDGVMQEIEELTSINLGVGGRVSKAASGNGIEVDFPNGSTLLVTPGWWGTHDIAYLNISVLNTPATEGIAGFIEPGQWLPALSDGSYLGPKPANLSERYEELNIEFSESWRLSDTSSLFDYAPGTSTETFTIKGWPFEGADSCEVPDMTMVDPIDRDVAEEVCHEIIDRDNRNNCVLDVAVTGEIGFAKTYLLAQRLEQAGTKTEIHPERKVTKEGEPATFIAVVKRNLTDQRLVFEDSEEQNRSGWVQFYFNGELMDEPVQIDRFGRAQWTSPELKAGEYKVSAEFLPARGDEDNLASRSFDLIHVVGRQ